MDKKLEKIQELQNEVWEEREAMGGRTEFLPETKKAMELSEIEAAIRTAGFEIKAVDGRLTLVQMAE